MSQETFWSNQNNAQKTVEESNSIKRQLAPLSAAEERVEDLKVLVEIGESESDADQPPVLQEATSEIEGVNAMLEELELQLWLGSPQD